MKPTLYFSTLLFVGIILVSCKSSYTEKQQEEAIETGKKENIAMDIPKPIPPNHCKVIATIEFIDQTMKGMNEKDPCGKAPCMATVRIDSILGYGSAFGYPLSPGQNILARFAHTLNPTSETQPDVKPALPGLSVGSTFEALVNASPVMGKSDPSYSIYGYSKK